MAMLFAELPLTCEDAGQNKFKLLLIKTNACTPPHPPPQTKTNVKLSVEEVSSAVLLQRKGLLGYGS